MIDFYCKERKRQLRKDYNLSPEEAEQSLFVFEIGIGKGGDLKKW
jgi:hypothetical protein